MRKQQKAKAIAISLTVEQQKEFLRRQNQRNIVLLSALFGLSGILYMLSLIQL
ncbi:unnamed protein product [Commensalibacter communis]|uniref:hypothetical protein n=1 Tax=Commensalibacter communis TaxID=2972786 RepID=UPI0022FF8BAE|nr:hypothetical protein [Commensalibacter communis]CAI3946081.1 unnamed protein product [Commensalibacter communis]CAI3947378.1 unnamed protein product [Commensalibacter communis]